MRTFRGAWGSIRALERGSGFEYEGGTAADVVSAVKRARGAQSPIFESVTR